jgi:hypothetical protein
MIGPKTQTIRVCNGCEMFVGEFSWLGCRCKHPDTPERLSGVDRTIGFASSGIVVTPTWCPVKESKAE